MGLAQNEDLPIKVKSAFIKNFGYNAEFKWEMAGINYWITFFHEKTKKRVLFDPDGNRIETRSFLKESQLPCSITDIYLSVFNEGYAKEIVWVEKSHDENYYEMIFDTGRECFFIVISNGIITQKDALPNQNNYSMENGTLTKVKL
jgi:hypothetical protein